MVSYSQQESNSSDKPSDRYPLGNHSAGSRRSSEEARRHQASSPCDMTPMVDVTFLLLIFFVVTASFQLQKAIDVSNTPSDNASQHPIAPVEVSELKLRVDRDGSFCVLASDWQKETPSKQALVTQLRQWRSGQVGDTSLLVSVQQDAQLQCLVDAMDAGTLAGFESLRFESVEEFP